MKALLFAVTLLIAAVDAAQFMTAETKAAGVDKQKTEASKSVSAADDVNADRWCGLWFSNCFELE